MPIADFGSQVESTAESIEQSDEIHDRNKELIREYHRDAVLNGLADATLLKNLSRLKVMTEHVGQPFDEMDKDDVKDLVEWIHSRDYTGETVETYKNVIKLFWNWMDGDGDDHPETVSWIKSNGSGGNGDTLPKNLLTKDDIERQAEAAKNPRDKALIWMLWETGARIGELIDLTVGDIEDRKNGKKVVIEGKTGARRVPLRDSVPYLNRWLNAHPNPVSDAPVWCKIQQGGPDDRLGYRYIRSKILAKTMDEAGIDKPSNPHHYRHSRASELASEMTESVLCQWFGWKIGSSTPAKYVHLSGRDVDREFDKMHGVYEPEDGEDEPTTINCWRCDELNGADDRFCSGCGAALDRDAVDELEEAEEKTTSDAEDEDLQLALQLVDHVKDNREEIRDILEIED